MQIGELATIAQTPIETIRFYERESLLPAPARNASNYRIYTEAHAERLAFVRHCRSLDMTLDEIRVLLKFMDRPQDNCSEVNELLDAHIGHVAHRIRELRALEKHLKALRQQCAAASDTQHCGILAELTHASSSTPPLMPVQTGHVHGAHARGARRAT